MAFLREVEKAAGDALGLSRGEGFHGLRRRDAEVLLAVDDQQRRLPITRKAMRGEAAILLGDLLALPIGADQVPIHKE